MTTRNALEFARDVADAFKAASGIDAQYAIDVCFTDLVACDIDADQRNAAIRGMLSAEFKEEDITRLLSLRRKTTSEAATFARAILTGVTWIVRRHPTPQLDPRQVAQMSILSFLVFLRPEGSSKGSNASREGIGLDGSLH